MVNEPTDAELEALTAKRLGGELADARRVAAARERVWSRIWPQLGTRARSRIGGLGWSAGAVATLVVVLLAVAWQQSYRVEVTQGHLPVLYREEIGRVEIGRVELSGGAVEATLVIQQRHIDGSAGLRTVAQIDVRVEEASLPATVEVRERDKGSQVTAVIGQSRGLSEVRSATRVARTDYTAPLPLVAEGETRTFEVWIWIETPSGVTETEKLTVEVAGRPEGERARLK